MWPTEWGFHLPGFWNKYSIFHTWSDPTQVVMCQWLCYTYFVDVVVVTCVCECVLEGSLYTFFFWKWMTINCFFKNWSIVDLKSANFRCVAKRVHYPYPYACIFIHSLLFCICCRYNVTILWESGCPFQIIEPEFRSELNKSMSPQWKKECSLPNSISYLLSSFHSG